MLTLCQQFCQGYIELQRRECLRSLKLGGHEFLPSLKLEEQEAAVFS